MSLSRSDNIKVEVTDRALETNISTPYNSICAAGRALNILQSRITKYFARGGVQMQHACMRPRRGCSTPLRCPPTHSPLPYRLWAVRGGGGGGGAGGGVSKPTKTLQRSICFLPLGRLQKPGIKKTNQKKK
nr:hypothetical protein [Morchella crassipes]